MGLIVKESLKFEVPLIPQTTAGNCAFACMAMVLKYRKLLDMAHFKSEAMALEALDNCNNRDNSACTDPALKPGKEADRYKEFRMSPEQFDGIPSTDPNRTFRRLGFQVETRRPQSARQLFTALRSVNGPLIFNSMGVHNINDSHFRLITGMDYCINDADNSADNDIESVLYLNDPWQKGMRKFKRTNHGSLYTMKYYEFFLEANKLQRNDDSLGVNKGSTIFFAWHN